MNRIRLCCRCGAENAWELVEGLEAAGALGVSLIPLEADAGWYEPEPGSAPLAGEVRVEALFATRAAAAAAAIATGIADRCSYAWLRERNWIAEGERGFSPQRFGKRLWVVPEWRDAPDPEALNVLIAPGLAFGTGSHPSTALCLEWLASADLNACSVIDFGCGSGVLAVAAARLGAARVCAVDNDPQACAATLANAQRNSVSIEVSTPDALRLLEADVLIANILARPLIALADELCTRTRVGGRIVLAGITVAQADVVSAAYLPCARMQHQFERGQWRCLELLRLESKSN